MRAYFLGNFYLSSIQQGIQAAHVVADMFIKYENTDDESIAEIADSLYHWAEEFKTMILLNGGMAADLQEMVDFLSSSDNFFPWAHFHEEQAAINSSITCVGIILPEYIYNAFQYVRQLPSSVSFQEKIQEYENACMERLTEFEEQLVERFYTLRLAI